MPLLFNMVLEVLARTVRQGKEIKIIQIWNKEVTVSICRWHDITYRKAKDSSKLEGYKINTQKSVAFFYINNELSEREVKKAISFTISSKGIKYLGINLTKEVKTPYIENYDINKKFKKTQINGKIFCVHGLDELILLKYSLLKFSRQSIDTVLSLFQAQWYIIFTKIEKTV